MLPAPDRQPALPASLVPRLIINADDCGRDAVCTETIIESLERGEISATSVMANGAYFEPACRLVRSHGLAGRIGVHLSLDEGPALSHEMRAFADASGNLCLSRALRPLGARLARAVEAECAAQVSRVIDAGIHPTHLDSHRHIHNVFPIGRIVVAVARSYGIGYVRPARNLSSTSGAAARTYKWLFNRYVSGRVRTADYFGDLRDFVAQRYRTRAASLVECMVHLDASPRGRSDLEFIRSHEFREFTRHYRLVGHADAGY